MSYPNVCDLFGGHVEEGETVEAALVRELREELDIMPSTFERFAALPDPQKSSNHLYHIYKVTSWTGRGRVSVAMNTRRFVGTRLAKL